MLLINLITDLGNSDHYLSYLTGQLHKHLQNFKIAGLNASIRPFDVRHAAFVLQNGYMHFPEKTIHLVHVNSVEANNRIVFCEFNNHYFVSFDNGILPLALNVTSEDLFVLQDEFLEKNDAAYSISLSRICSFIERKYSLSDIGERTDKIVKSNWFVPVINDNIIRATVIHVDHFGNIVLNITREFFASVFKSGQVSFQINRIEVPQLCNNINDVEEGDIACFFNADGFLEIAVKKGIARKLLGIDLDQTVYLIKESN